jgi:small subunit ribosomal protein S5
MKREDKRISKYDTRTVDIRRVAKVTAGAKRLRFSAMVVAGDRKGSVGVGLGRGVDTRSAVNKGINIAERNMKKIQVVGDTIPHEVVMKIGASKMLLRPARPGTGIIAGPSARAVLELAGIENVYAKVLGSNNLVANTYCTFEALKSLRNERVLSKMNKMQERIGLKEELDKERKRKEIARRKREREKKGDRKERFRKNKGRYARRETGKSAEVKSKINKKVTNETGKNPEEKK